MKKLALCFVIAAGCLLHSATAQIKLDLSVNIGSQPIWGPPGYDHAEYYYMPDLDVYYDVPRHRYIYWEGSRQVFATALPPRFGNPNLYGTYKVVVNEPKAYMHHDQDRAKYAQYKGHHDQPVIRDNHEQKYLQIKNHPEHSKWNGKDRGGPGPGGRH